MTTIITIKKNKPANKALILLARELEKNDNTSISIKELSGSKEEFDLILPLENAKNPFSLFDLLYDFPTIDEIRKTAWPKI
ncbi:hypothetical protein [Roseimarinus sediminis]|uniref:hypothetical protein n=1 Tax=Roseimarinus sediminis TaxID=1610899 RepID=UPI003D20A674